jgi:hypothetical protein
MVVFVPEKKRPLVMRLAAEWAAALSSGGRGLNIAEIRSLCGFMNFLAIVLRFLKKQMALLFAFSSKAQRAIEVGQAPAAKRLTNEKAGASLGLVWRLLEDWNWEVPLFDWGWQEGPDVVIHADAAVPKSQGLDYSGSVWGFGAHTVFVRGGGQGWYYSEMIESEVVEAAKRKAALSSPYLEFMNYVKQVELACQMPGVRRIRIIGDCKPAIGWLRESHSTDAAVREVIFEGIKKQVQLGFVCQFVLVKREVVSLADRLSREDGHVAAMSSLEQQGLRRVRWARCVRERVAASLKQQGMKRRR